MEKCNVAIVGCGLAGVATAVAIQRAGHCATIIEQASGVTEIGAGIQLPPNCTRILHRWKILSTIEQCATRPSSVVLRAYKDGQVLFRRCAPGPAPGVTELPHLVLHRAEFLKILVNEARRLGLAVRFNAMKTTHDFEKATIRLLDGKEEGYDVIFGADGSKSFCRGLLFGKSHGPQLSGDVAYRIMVPVREILGDRDLSIFVETPDVSCWMGPDAHVVCYRLEKEGLLNVVMSQRSFGNRPARTKLGLFHQPYRLVLNDIAQDVSTTFRTIDSYYRWRRMIEYLIQRLPTKAAQLRDRKRVQAAL